jgi:site-specific recombinase XerC
MSGGLKQPLTQHPLFDAELPALMRWLKVRRRWREADSDWLFLSQKGGPLSRHQVDCCSNVTVSWAESAFQRIPIC